MMSIERVSRISRTRPIDDDYRYTSYSDEMYEPHFNDCSLYIYRRHSVLGSRIRCHFSSSESTNSSYVYSGSADDKVYIYNMNTTLTVEIDVAEAAWSSDPCPDSARVAEEYCVVRDAS